MGRLAPVTGGSDKAFEKPLPGTYTAICNGVYNCGKQEGYKGGKPTEKLLLTFELHKRKGPARDKSGNIFECSATVSNTANIKSSLIAMYAGPMRGKAYTEDELKALGKQGGFNPETLLGGCCKITLALAESGNPYVETVAALDPEDDLVPDQETSQYYWDYTIEGAVPRRCAWLWAKSLDNPINRDAAKNAASAIADQLGDMMEGPAKVGVAFGKINVPLSNFTAPDSDVPY